MSSSSSSSGVVDKLWRGYLLMNAVGAGLSSLLYFFVPEGSVQTFGGTASATSAAWCRIVGPGDVLVTFLAATALRTSNAELFNACLGGVGLYSLLHGGAFLYSHSSQPGAFALPGTSMFVGTGLMCAFGALATLRYLAAQMPKKRG